MSDMSTTSIHRVGPYQPSRRPAPMPPMQPPYTQLPSIPMPQMPPMPPMPPMGQYPSYPSRPNYPSYPTQPSYPQYPTQPQYPQYPSQPNYPYPGQNRGVGAFLGDVWSGVKERSHEIGQFILHPINNYARRPYMGRNPYQPRTGGETTGRWLVNGLLIVGAFLGGRALIGGGVGGGAGAGMSGFLGRVAQVVAAPFQWAARGIGAVLTGAKDLIGGLLSGIFGGARVGFR